MQHQAARRRIAPLAIAFLLALPSAALAGAGASIEQVRNGQATATVTPIPSWGTGNAGASNSHYLESHSTGYRAVMTGLPTDGTVVEIVIGYDVKRSGAYALDYLTHYQRLLPHVTFGHRNPEVFNPLDGVSGVGSVVTTALIPVPTRNISVDPDGAGPELPAVQPTVSAAALPDSERAMTLFGGNLINVSYDTEADVALATSSSESRVRVRFTPTSPTAVLAWGGHIACRWDWGFNADGTPRSAGGISGSSYHMRLVGWSLGSLGSQDRSMSTDAVYPVPRCAISNLGPFCAGTTNSHTAPAGMETYKWTLFDNTAGAVIVGSDTSTTVTVSTSTDGSYSLMLSTGASGFTRQCQATVIVNPKTLADAGPDLAACATSPQVQLAGTVSGGTGAWTGGAGTFSPGRSALNATYTPTAAEIAAGGVTLTLSATSSGPCANATDPVRITITPAVNTNAGADQIVCAASPLLQLAGLVSGGATTGTWSGGAGTFTPGPNVLNATYLPSADEIAAGSVILTLTSADPAGPCDAVADAMKITINPIATADAGGDQIVCASSPQVTLAGTVGGAATTGTWSGGTGTFAPNASAMGAVYTPSAAEIAAGSVTLTLTTNDPAGPCGVARAQMHVAITPAVTTNAGADQVVCAVSPLVQLAGLVSGGATTGTWSGGTGTFTPGPNALNATYLPSTDEIAAGSVVLTLTSADPAGPCNAIADAMKITINPVATADAGADQIVCATSPQVTLAGLVGGAATGGTWSGGTGKYAPNASTPGAVYTPSAAEIAAGGVTLTLTTNDPAGPCGAVSDAMHVTITPAVTTDAGIDQVVCAASPLVQLSGHVSGGATTGSWSGGTGTFSPGPNALFATYLPSASEIAAGSVTLTLTSADPAGPCDAVADAMKITINPVATADAGAAQTVCASSPQVTLAGAIGGAATSGTWSGGAGIYSPSASALNAVYTPSAGEIAGGGVTLTLTTNDPAGVCGAVADAVRITINPAAVANAGLDAAVCASSPQVQLAGSVSGAASGGTWTGGTGTFVPGRSSLNATYTPSAAEIAAGTVTLTLVTNDPSGPCPAVNDAVTITILPAATVNAGADQIVCASSAQVKLQGTVGGGASGGTWTGGAGTYSPNASTLDATYFPSTGEIAAGGVTLTLITNDPAGPCGALSDAMRITIDPVTRVDAGPDPIVCSSSPQVTLHGTVTGAVTTGSWFGGTGTFSPGRNALDVVYTPTASEIAAGTVTLILQSSPSSRPCPAASDLVNVWIRPAVSVSAGPDQIVCRIAPQVQLAGSIGNGATGATWSGGSGTFNPGPTTLNALYMPSAAEIAAGKVTLTLTTNDPAGPCPPVSDAMTITIDSPVVSVPTKVTCNDMGPATLCASVSKGVPPYTYLWNTGATTQCITVADTARYTVSVTDAQGCRASGAGFYGWRDCVGMIAHTNTTCGSFLDGTGSPILPGDVSWGVRDGVISNIAPGVFFYFTKVRAPSTSFTINIQQLKDNPVFPFCPVQQGTQVTLYDANCGTIGGGVETSPGQATINVTNAQVGQIFIVSVKYSLKELIGTPMPDSTGCRYNFQTEVNGLIVDRDPDGLQIGTPKPALAGNGTANGGGGIDGGPRPKGGFGTFSMDATENVALYRPMPNPFSDGMRMAYAVGGSGEDVSIRVYDVAGRMMRTLASGFQSAGNHVVTWDGHDEQGAPCHRGVYFVHARIGGETRLVRVTFLK